ncbi:protease complex subunit PrcB family protein [Rhodopirellula halodulae]|uniref:protease complex subunit PrcB family protein n=1 Tax=Rhodopirellula halodulae TaxID=2894198 RepID=UPI001E5153D0|nr:protease complex subunit PrcB family protein [Rhodopirellula sp. JC737]MCC9658300.1 protease complex subunit PrcB family protein [Rhodopirellula sp. JC737]
MKTHSPGKILVTVLLFAVLGGVGCTQPTSPLPIAEQDKISILRTVSLDRIEQEGVEVVRSEAQLMKLLGTSSNEHPSGAPKVDFEKETLLIASLGECNSTGCSISIQGISLQNSLLKVFVKRSSPTPGRMVGMAMTYPSHAVVVAKLPADIAVEVVSIES